MKKYSISNSILGMLSEYKYYSSSKGVTPLLSSDIKEFKIGKKYAYNLSANMKSKFDDISLSLNENYFSKIEINQSATAYVKGKSYFNFIEPHRHNYFFLRLDLKNFFHSITKNVLIDNLSDYFSTSKISETCEQTHLDAVYNLVTMKLDTNFENVKFHNCDILPMGFPLSPVISNIVFRKVDILIEKYCDENNVIYTRYADDMLFSSKGNIKPEIPFFDRTKDKRYDTPYIHSERFFDQLSYILSVDGYKINKNKTLTSVNTMSLNGYTISGSNFSDVKGTIRISNKKIKPISKFIYELNNNKNDVEVFKKCFSKETPIAMYSNGFELFLKEFCKTQINNKIVGYRSYLISILKFDNVYNCVDINSKDKYRGIVKELDLLIGKRFKN